MQCESGNIVQEMLDLPTGSAKTDKLDDKSAYSPIMRVVIDIHGVGYC